MVIDRNRKSDLGFFLTDNLIVELLLDLTRSNKLLGLDGAHLTLLIDLLFFSYDTVSRSYTVNANIAVNTRKKSRYFILGFAAERAPHIVFLTVS